MEYPALPSFTLLVIIVKITSGQETNARKVNCSCVYTLRTYWNQFSLGAICKQE